MSLLFTITARAQVNYSISGTAPSEVVYVILSDIATHQQLDSCFTSKGSFHFEGTLPENTFVNLTDNRHEFDASLIIEETPVVVDLGTNVIKGSELNEKFSDYYRQLMRLQVNVISDYHRREALMADTTQTAERQKIERSIQLQLENITAVEKGIVDSNMGNVISAYFLRDLSADLTLNELRGYLNEHYPYRNNPILYPALQRMRELENEETN
ncbi:MAG: DUF4369 domain-containing protein [Bacteroidaceae bacterium]|nr:DUF4369 domain-containing protein [Bacteroidaceae bacterium]